MPRVALLSGVQFTLGTAVGTVFESLFPVVNPRSSTGMMLVEVAAEAAVLGAVVAMSDRTVLNAIDPDNEAGGGMYFLGLAYSTPSLAAKSKILAGRARLVVEALKKGPSDKAVKVAEQNDGANGL